MRDSSAALLTRAMGLVKALLTPARGRHSAAARRRRSTRVRRYAPLPAAATAPKPLPSTPARPPLPAPRPSASRRPVPRPSAPRLAPPRRTPPAEDTALVRPYYTAHEHELDRVQARATARLHHWALGTSHTAPAGDLLSGDPFCHPPHDFDQLLTLWPEHRPQNRQGVVA